MIRAYPRSPSVFCGEALILHVSTDSPRFRVEFLRQGRELAPIRGIESGPFAGSYLPDGPPDLDWGWTGYRFDIPVDWPAGVYVAVTIEIDANGVETKPDMTTTFARSAKALFIVRTRDPVPHGTPIYKLSWATFAAYNATGYGSLYAEAVWSRDERQPGFKVTWRRPGCGTGGMVMAGSPLDVYHPDSDRQTFEHWDAPFVRWLEAEGYAPHYCTDWDIHRDPGLLDSYSLLLNVGHDEYWSASVRSAVDAHVKRGGNVAFLSGNTAYYRIHFTDDDTAITCAKVLPAAKEPDSWIRDSWTEVDPESRLTGVTTAFGGGIWDGPRPPLGYRVQHAGHWLFVGSGLEDDEVFGDDPNHPIIGYEVDGAAFRTEHGRALPTGELGTPRDFVILGTAELGEEWYVSRRGAAATMGMYVSPRGGIVFQGATTDWPMLVPVDKNVQCITRNLLDRLRWPSLRILGPLPGRAGRLLAAASETVSFHADLGGFVGLEGLEFRWRVAGAGVVEDRGTQIRVELPTEPDFVTVSLQLSRAGRPVGFGTRTFMPLTTVEAARVAVLIDLRELSIPDDPSSPMVSPTHDPLQRSDSFTPVHLPELRRRAERLRKSIAEVEKAYGGAEGEGSDEHR